MLQFAFRFGFGSALALGVYILVCICSVVCRWATFRRVGTSPLTTYPRWASIANHRLDRFTKKHISRGQPAAAGQASIVVVVVVSIYFCRRKQESLYHGKCQKESRFFGGNDFTYFVGGSDGQLLWLDGRHRHCQSALQTPAPPPMTRAPPTYGPCPNASPPLGQNEKEDPPTAQGGRLLEERLSRHCSFIFKNTKEQNGKRAKTFDKKTTVLYKKISFHPKCQNCEIANLNANLEKFET